MHISAYVNVFLNSNASFFNLYSEDSGDIVVTNINGKLSDFFQYSVFDENYIKTKFNIENPVIIRRRTFNEKISNEWHSSNSNHPFLFLQEISLPEIRTWNRCF